MRSQGKIVLAIASSGIASLLLPAGRTAHSRFKLPLELTDESLCNIKKNTHAASLLAETNLIIWDESPMNDRRCFKALDWTLRDILNVPDKLFGGKTIVLGGDFRQTLPVKKGASKSEIVGTSISESELWPHFKICRLRENMRLLQPGLTEDERRRAANFATWLLEIGDGKVGKVKDNSEGFIYDEQTLQQPTVGDLQQKAIVCPKNTTADEINATILEMLHCGDVVELTLWDNMATDFSPEEFEKMEQPVVFAVSSCKATIYGGIQLSGTPTTHYYFNTDIPGLEELRDQYRQRLNLNPPLQISKEKCSDINAEQNRNRFPLSTLLQQNPDGYRSVRFTSKATITNVNTSRDWYYQSCNDCLMKVTDKNGEAYCVNHGRQKPSYRYNFKDFLTDESATALVTFFTPNADVLTRSSCTQLVKKYGGEWTSTLTTLWINHYRLLGHPRLRKYQQIEEIPTDPLPVGTPTLLPGISGSAQTITVTLLPTTPETSGTYPRATASVGATTGTTEGQPSDTPNPVAETTTKNAKRTLFG
ncbi:DNA helicase [Tanacetum coccineum]